MAQLPRIVLPGIPHHVTQRGNRREQTFFEDGDYALYLNLLADAADRSGVEIWSQYAFDLTTPAGRGKYATALTAFTNQRNVQITGADTCTDWGDRETVNEIGLAS